MASGSETKSIGVAIQGSFIRAVVVEVGHSTSVIKRFASMQHGGTDIARSVGRIADALDSAKNLPVGVTSGRLSETVQREVMSAVAPSRTVALFRREVAIAHLDLAPGTKLDSVDGVPGCAVPPRLFEVHPDLRFPDLLDPIGAALAMADDSTPGSAPSNPETQDNFAVWTPPKNQAPPQNPATVTMPVAPTRPAASAPNEPSVTPVAAAAAVAQPVAETRPVDPTPNRPTRINLSTPDLTAQGRRRPTPGGASPAGADPHDDDLTVAAPQRRRPAPAAKLNPDVIDGSPAAPIRIALSKSDSGQPDWRNEGDRTFGIPVVRLATDESADPGAIGGTKRRRLVGRRPLPLALAALVVLLGVGIALGVFLGGDGSLVDQAATGLNIALLAT